MEISYYREMNHSHMLECNTVGGLLPLRVQQMDGYTEWDFNITARQPMTRMLEQGAMSCGELRRLIQDIYQTMAQMEKYLLDINCLCLREGLIYAEYTKQSFAFCFLPDEQETVFEQLRKLLQFLLDKIDYEDREGVELLYHLHRIAAVDGYTMGELMRLAEAGARENDRSRLPAVDRESSACSDICENVSYEYDRPGKTLSANGMRKILQRIGLSVRLVFSRITERYYKKEKSKSDRQELPEFKEEYILEEYGQTELLADVGETYLYLRSLSPECCRDIRINKKEFIIGRQENAVDGVICHYLVSRLHARLFRIKNCWYIEDMKSTNGTRLNDVRLNVNEKHELKEGDEIQVSEYPILFRVEFDQKVGYDGENKY